MQRFGTTKRWTTKADTVSSPTLVVTDVEALEAKTVCTYVFGCSSPVEEGALRITVLHSLKRYRFGRDWAADSRTSTQTVETVPAAVVGPLVGVKPERRHRCVYRRKSGFRRSFKTRGLSYGLMTMPSPAQCPTQPPLRLAAVIGWRRQWILRLGGRQSA